jgi:hypothetical protein
MKGKLVMKNRNITFMSNAEQSNLANNHSESERSQIMRQMTMFAQRVCSMLCGAFFVGAFVLTLVAIPSGASAFTFTTIDPPGATATGAYRINARGQIVGNFIDVSGTSHGFLLDKGTFTTIDVPGATITDAWEINARGQIVGQYEDTGDTFHGVLLDRGTLTAIDVPGATETIPTGINNHGQIVGLYVDVSGTTHGFTAQ